MRHRACDDERNAFDNACVNRVERQQYFSACDKARISKPSGFFVRFDCDSHNYFINYFSICFRIIINFSFILCVLLIIMDENKTLQFIESYKAAKLLWDANHPDYCNKIKRNDALESIANEFNIDVSAVKIKIKNLRSYFSKERQKSLKRKSGLGADETYVSSWFAYTPLLFVSDSSTPRETVDSEQEHENPENSDFNISAQVSI